MTDEQAKAQRLSEFAAVILAMELLRNATHNSVPLAKLLVKAKLESFRIGSLATQILAASIPPASIPFPKPPAGS